MPAAGAGAPGPQVTTTPGRSEPYEIRLEQAQAEAHMTDERLARVKAGAAWSEERAAAILADARKAVADTTAEAEAAHARVRGIENERTEQ